MKKLLEKITSSNVSKNKKLAGLGCEKNQLNTLDLRKNTTLVELWCPYNQLTSLDLRKNKTLKGLNCSNNNFSEMALNALFKTLHNNEFEYSQKHVSIYGNYGTETCDKNITEKKDGRYMMKKIF
jgi:hypothetical protein